MNLRDFIASLTPDARKRFARLALTPRTHLLQLTGGWRRASARLRWRMVRASRVMFPDESARWLTLEEMQVETDQIYRGPGAEPKRKRTRKARAKKPSSEGVAA